MGSRVGRSCGLASTSPGRHCSLLCIALHIGLADASCLSTCVGVESQPSFFAHPPGASLCRCRRTPGFVQTPGPEARRG